MKEGDDNHSTKLSVRNDEFGQIPPPITNQYSKYEAIEAAGKKMATKKLIIHKLNKQKEHRNSIAQRS